MQVVGFNLIKISAEREKARVTSKPSTGIEFTDIEKEKVELLKDQEVVKISFKYLITYGDTEKKKQKPQGEVLFEGDIALSVTKEEAKEITKAWKKKQLPPGMNLNLFNVILRRCTPKAIFLEDEINLPFHTPMPKLSPKPSDN